jgi:phasin
MAAAHSDVEVAVDQMTQEAQSAARDFADKGMAQAKDFYERGRESAEKATEMFESSMSTASKGAQDFGLKAIELARQNANTAFDFAVQLMGVKSFSQAVELQSAFARKQLESLAEQAKELTAIAQKSTAESVKPFQEMASKGFKLPN